MMVDLEATELVLKQIVYDADALRLVLAGVILEQFVSQRDLLGLPGILKFFRGGEPDQVPGILCTESVGVLGLELVEKVEVKVLSRARHVHIDGLEGPFLVVAC